MFIFCFDTNQNIDNCRLEKGILRSKLLKLSPINKSKTNRTRMFVEYSLVFYKSLMGSSNGMCNVLEYVFSGFMVIITLGVIV